MCDLAHGKLNYQFKFKTIFFYNLLLLNSFQKSLGKTTFIFKLLLSLIKISRETNVQR